MASKKKRPDGGWDIRYGRHGKGGDYRRTIRLGDVTTKEAEAARLHVGHLVDCSEFDAPMSAKTAKWLDTLDDKVHARIAAKGLCEPRVIAGKASDWYSQQTKRMRKRIDDAGLRHEAGYYESRCENLSQLCDHYIVWKWAVKECGEGTLNNYRQLKAKLTKFFGGKRQLSAITPSQMEDWFAWLRREGGQDRYGQWGRPMSPVSASRIIRASKDLFGRAARSGWMDPGHVAKLFFHSPKDVRANPKRQFIVTEDMMKRCIEHALNNEQRLIFALARWCMVRVPSEIEPLTWDCVDWEHEKILVRSQKQSKHEWKHERWVPIFPEVMPYLQEQWNTAKDGDQYIIRRYRYTRRDTSSHSSLLKRAAFHAGLTKRESDPPWPKAWTNCRSTRVTELRQRFPVDIVNYWANHSEDVSRQHYQQAEQWENYNWKT